MSEAILIVCVIVFLVCAMAGSRLLHEGLGHNKKQRDEQQSQAQLQAFENQKEFMRRYQGKDYMAEKMQEIFRITEESLKADKARTQLEDTER